MYNKIKNILIAILITFVPILVKSQGFYNRHDYRTKRHEINFGAGASSCLTDLGGRDAIGSGFLWDIDIAKTSYVGSFSYIYNAFSKVSFRLNLAYLNISGDDAYAGNFYRNNRRLNFETAIIESSFICELTLVPEKSGNRYNMRGPARKYLKARKTIGIGFYVYGGVGGFHFEPSGYDRFTNKDGEIVGTGTKYKLRPLHTEGQGMENGPDGFAQGETYSPIALCVPLGFGIKKAFNGSSGIKIEAGFRFTNTDYLDDVSTLYYNREILSQRYGESAGIMSGTSTGETYNYIGYATDGEYPINATEEPEMDGTNPYSLEKAYTDPGYQRGNPKNDDSYMYITMSAYKKFKNHAKHKYKPMRNQKRKVKASF